MLLPLLSSFFHVMSVYWTRQKRLTTLATLALLVIQGKLYKLLGTQSQSQPEFRIDRITNHSRFLLQLFNSTTVIDFIESKNIQIDFTKSSLLLSYLCNFSEHGTWLSSTSTETESSDFVALLWDANHLGSLPHPRTLRSRID
jgi:hypothetical protein